MYHRVRTSSSARTDGAPECKHGRFSSRTSPILPNKVSFLTFSNQSIQKLLLTVHLDDTKKESIGFVVWFQTCRTFHTEMALLHRKSPDSSDSTHQLYVYNKPRLTEIITERKVSSQIEKSNILGCHSFWKEHIPLDRKLAQFQADCSERYTVTRVNTSL